MDKPKISFETERLTVRTIEEADKENYMGLRVSASPMWRAYEEFPEFKDHVWESELNSTDEIYLAVFLKNDHTFVASASYQNFDTDTIEIGLDVLEQYRNQGIGTELLKGMLRTKNEVFPGTTVKVRTDVTNTACRRVAEKCGGVFTENEPTLAARAFAKLMESFGDEPTEDEELIQRRKEATEFIEENKAGVCVYLFE